MNRRFLTGTLLALGGITGWGYGNYRRAMDDKKAQIEARTRVAETAAGRVEYAQVGEGPAVLVSHGSMQGADHIDPVKRMLPDFQVMMPSRFGYGRSDVPVDTSPAAQADTYLALLDYLGVDKVAVLGLSAGGPAALEFALRYPDRCHCLVMISALTDPTALPDLYSSQIMVTTFTMAAPVFWFLTTQAQSVVMDSVGVTPAQRERLQRDSPEMLATIQQFIADLNPVESRLAGVKIDIASATRYRATGLSSLDVPMLVIHGDADPLVPISQANTLLEQVPHADLLTLAGGGHLAIFTHYDEAAPRLRDFIYGSLPVY